MKKITFLCSLLLISSATLASQSKATHGNFIVFGDSISDSALPCTNDPHDGTGLRVWPEYLANDAQSMLDSPKTKSRTAKDINVNTDNIDYAVAGATATCSKAGDNCVGTQLTQYFKTLDTQASIEPSTKVILLIGGNDFLFHPTEVAAKPAELAKKTTEALSNDIVKIKDRETAAGHYDIYVINLPEIGNIPLFNGNASARTAYNKISLDYDNDLTELSTVLSDTTHTVKIIDMNKLLFEKLDADPQKYGFDTADAQHNFTPCTTSIGPSQGKCEGKIFNDVVHFTTAVHSLFAKEVNDSIYFKSLR